MAKYRILFVDDDALLLEFYQMLGGYLGEHYEVFCADGGEQALAFLATHSMDMVVSDLMMSDMSGQELMTQLIRSYPEPIRCIVSGYVDQLKIAQSLMFAHRYFQKPLSLKPFCAALRRMCELRRLVSSPRIKQIVCGFSALPTPPETYRRLDEALNAPATSIDNISEIVMEDAALCLKVLRIVNSAEFGVARRIATPAEAVQILGVEILRSLMLGVQAFKFYESAEPKSLSMTQLWNHSLKVAIGARKLARLENLTPEQSEEAFVAGLFHDIGKLVLAANADAEYVSGMKRSHAEGISMIQMEREIFGATHADIGAYLLGLWGMPDSVIEAVELHHSVEAGHEKCFSPLLAVHIAQCFDSETNRISELNDDYLKQIGLDHRIGEWTKALTG